MRADRDRVRRQHVQINSQARAAVGMNAGGAFVIAWESPGSSNYGIVVRRFNSAGTPQASPVQVNSYATAEQAAPAAVASSAAGYLEAGV